MRQALRIFTVTICSAAVACSSSEPSAPADQHLIPLGALAANTGPTASLLYAAAIDMAAKQMNQGLEMAGSAIRFDMKVLDSQGDPARSVVAVAELMKQHKAKGLVVDTSANTIAVNAMNYDPATTAENKAAITCYVCSSSFIKNPAATNPDPIQQAASRDADTWLFRVFMNNKYGGAAQAQIIANKGTNGDVNGDGKLKVGFYAQDDAFGKSFVTAIKDALTQISMNKIPLSTEAVYIPATTNAETYAWDSDLAKLVNNLNEATSAEDGYPDAIFLSMFPVYSTGAAKAYRGAKYAPALYAEGAFRRIQTLRALNTAANDIEGHSTLTFSDDDSGRGFNTAFQKFASEPPENRSAVAYDASVALMLATLIASAPLPNPSDVTRSAIREALFKINDPMGETIRTAPEDYARAAKAIASGKAINYLGAFSVKFDSHGENYPSFVHWKVAGGDFVEAEQYDCSPTNPVCARLVK